MDIQTVVQSWIQWSEQHLPLTGDIPKINIQDPAPPWIENSEEALTVAIDHGERLRTCFLNYLIDDPINIPARFTVLAVYYALSYRDRRYVEKLQHFVANRTEREPTELEKVRAAVAEDYPEELIWEGLADNLIEGFGDDLSLVVRQLKAEDIPDDWRVIRWEILNSYAISDWKRALKLYSIAEESNLLDLCDLELIRGQFRYLLVFGPKLGFELESLWWEPKILGADSLLLPFMSGLRLNQFKPELTDSTIDTLRDASNDLEKALSKRPELSPLYGPMLARCYFSTGRLHDAAVIYEQALTEWAKGGIRQWIYESLKMIYQESHLPEKAIALLERWAAEFPDEKGLYMQIAELQAQVANLGRCPLVFERRWSVIPKPIGIGG